MVNYTYAKNVCRVANATCFIVGLACLWNMTHSWAAVGAGFLAALHFEIPQGEVK